MENRFGKYLLQKKIGEGGFGVVYHARDCELHRDVAIKFMHPGDIFAQQEKQQAFVAEIRRLAALDIPGTVRLYDAGEKENVPYFTMEYIRGEEIDSYCRNHPLSLLKKCALFLQIAETLRQLHDSGIIHRDIKAANIMVDSCGAVKVLDFGIALSVQELKGFTPKIISGSMGYLAPEILLGSAAPSESSDVYSLGVLFYVMLTGRMPFQTQSLSLPEMIAGQLNTKPAPLQDFINEAVPERLEKLAGTLLAVSPQNRPAVQEIATELRSILRYDFAENAELELMRDSCKDHAKHYFSPRTLIHDAVLLDQMEKIYCFRQKFLLPEEKRYIQKSLLHAGRRSPGVYWLSIGVASMLGRELFLLQSSTPRPFPFGTLLCICWFLIWIWRFCHRKPLSDYSRLSWCIEAVEMGTAALICACNREFFALLPGFAVYFAERIRLYRIRRNYLRYGKLPKHLNWHLFWKDWPLAFIFLALLIQNSRGAL